MRKTKLSIHQQISKDIAYLQEKFNQIKLYEAYERRENIL